MLRSERPLPHAARREATVELSCSSMFPMRGRDSAECSRSVVLDAAARGRTCCTQSRTVLCVHGSVSSQQLLPCGVVNPSPGWESAFCSTRLAQQSCQGDGDACESALHVPHPGSCTLP